MTENRSRMQDTVIKADEDKIVIYKRQVLLMEAKEEEYEKMISTLQTSLKLEKIKSKTFLYMGIGVFVAGSVYAMTRH